MILQKFSIVYYFIGANSPEKLGRLPNFEAVSRTPEKVKNLPNFQKKSLKFLFVY